jgi:hypothetical protein
MRRIHFQNAYFFTDPKTVSFNILSKSRNFKMHTNECCILFCASLKRSPLLEGTFESKSAQEHVHGYRRAKVMMI